MVTCESLSIYKSSTFIFFLTVKPMSDSTFSMVVGWYLGKYASQYILLSDNRT